MSAAAALSQAQAVQKRAVPRYVFKRSGQLHVAPSSFFPIKTLDISSKGIGIMSPHSLPLRQRCLLKVPVFQNGVTGELVVQADVMCCILNGVSGFRIGFEFRNVDSTSEKLIARIIQNSFS